MARPKKIGLDYFPMDVGFLDSDIMVAVAGKFGSEGIHVTLRILTSIYKNGYYITFDELFALRLAKEVSGVNEERITEIVESLVRWNLFDKSLFDEHKVLTSKDIQEQYFIVVNRNTRENGVDKPYLLTDSFPENNTSCEFSDGKPQENDLFPTENPEKPTVSRRKMPQSKVKESKENKTLSNDKDFMKEKIPPNGVIEKEKEPAARFIKPTLEELREYIAERGYEFDPETFIAHYESNGWKVNRAPMKSWRGACTTWQKRLEEERRREKARIERYEASRASPPSPPPKELIRSPIPEYTDEEWNRLDLWEQDKEVHRHFGLD